MNPCISVVMPVYNAEEYVAEAIQSIIGQTFTDFEFIIIDDGSTDNSLEIIKSHNDKRIIIIENAVNKGNYAARNKGHRMARGKYICVMDADDISVSDRLEKQYAFMEQNPDIGLAGSCIKYVGSNQPIFREPDYELNKIKLLHNNYICHPSIIMRHELLKKHDLHYDESFWYAGDYELMVRASALFPVVNTKDVLLNYRWTSQQLSASINKYKPERDRVVIQQLAYFGITPTEKEIDIHLQLIYGIPFAIAFKTEALQWLHKLSEANKTTKYYHIEYFADFVDSLLKQQPFFKKEEEPTDKSSTINEKSKINLTDVTFVIALHIDSDCCLKNMDTVLRLIDREFATQIIVLEADTQQRYFLLETTNAVAYSFVYDESPVFHATRYRNQMLKMVRTPYAAVWDADVLTMPEQIALAVEKLRNNEAVLAYPYDGGIFNIDPLLSKLFHSLDQYQQLMYQTPNLSLLDTHRSNDGAFFVNCQKYLNEGGENENIYGLGQEGDERVKRMEVLSLPISRTSGALFRLWHPRKTKDGTSSLELEKQNRKVFIETCQHQI